MDEPGNGWRRHLWFGLKVLADFAKNGRMERAFADIQSIHLHPAMQNTLRDYEHRAGIDTNAGEFHTHVGRRRNQHRKQLARFYASEKNGKTRPK